jgi:DNA-binding NtrC family response regulator
VLITGPNGSGKEKLAEIVQANSRRKDEPFVRVNVGALPESLFEAELFGAEAGAFTGAQKLRVGRFEAAEGGTLFLDELGTLPLAAQAKLLRVLQTGEFERLGSSVTRKANVRLISATNLDIPRAIAAGQFREDLYFRLNVVELFVPPLADRADDVAPLAEHFLTTFAAKEHRPGLRFGGEAMAALANHEWPGNVRELANRVQRAVLVQPGETIGAADLGLGAPPARAETRRPAPTPAAPSPARALDPESEAERAAIEEALLRAGGVVAKAAAEMGLSRQALYRRMERLGIVMERRPK